MLLPPADELEGAIDRTGAAVGSFVFFQKNEKGRLMASVLLAFDPQVSPPQAMNGLRALGQAVLTEHERLLAGYNKQSSLILPGGNQ